MMEGIGTTWMKMPLRRLDDDAAYKQTIAKMNTMKELRPFMCPKSHGNFDECRECSGFRTCQAGQRAAVLMAKKAEAGVDRDEFQRACESGNAWNYLMETHGMSKDAAGDLLTRMIKKFPGVAADYGGGRRIMQRPKVVKIMSATVQKDEKLPENPQDGQEQASQRKAEEEHAQEEKAAKQAENGRKLDAAIQARVHAASDKARERCRLAVESGDPYKYLLDEGQSQHNTTNTISRWRKNYPDLMKDVPMLGAGNRYVNVGNAEKREGAKAFYVECMRAEDPVAYYMEKCGVCRKSATTSLCIMRKRYAEPEAATPEVTEMPKDEEPKAPEVSADDDQISLEDFLSEMGVEDSEPEQPETAPERDSEPAREVPNGNVQDELEAKYTALDAEKDGLRAQIEKAEERIRCIEELQEALARVLHLFR